MGTGTLQKPTKIECKESQLKRRVLPLLLDRVFHVTTLKNFKSISVDGSIKSNRDGRFSSHFGGWSDSYAAQHAFVCLTFETGPNHRLNLRWQDVDF